LTKARISHKIVSVLCLFALLGAGMTALAVTSIEDLARKQQHLVDQHVAALRITAVAQEHLTRLHQLAFQMHDAEPADRSALEQTVRTETDEMLTAFGELDPLLESSDRNVFQAAAAGAKSYVAMGDKSLALLA